MQLPCLGPKQVKICKVIRLSAFIAKDGHEFIYNHGVFQYFNYNKQEYQGKLTWEEYLRGWISSSKFVIKASAFKLFQGPKFIQ